LFISELRTITAPKCLYHPDYLPACLKTGHTKRLGYKMRNQALRRQDDMCTRYKNAEQFWSEAKVEGQHPHPVMTVKDSESRRRLSLCTIERIGKAPDTPAPLAPFVQLHCCIFNNPERRICHYSME
jgi:hypothetical protein